MRIHLILLSIMLCLGGPGCNSRATLEDNNGNNQSCGNSKLDQGEVCDTDLNSGFFLFQAGDSCVARGYVGGYLGCTAQCTIITSNCTPLVTYCSPFNDEGCDGTTCFFFPDTDTDATACADPGMGAEDTWCDTPFQCLPRHTCFNNACRKVCNRGSTDECTNNAQCVDMPWLNGTLGVCPLPPGGCDPVSGTGCPDPQACYLNSGLGGGRCAPEGSGPTGSPCGPDTDCMPGHVCLKLTNPLQGYCTRLCNADIWCDHGSSWCAFYPGVPAGFCPEQSACHPMTGGCPDEQACTVINPTGTTSCMLTQARGENESCDMFTRCAQGLYCATELDMKCHRVCQANADCGGGQFCVEMPGWQSTNGLMGYCRNLK